MAVYTKFADCMIEDRVSQVLFSAAIRCHRDSPGLPSWVPDWTTPPFPNSLNWQVSSFVEEYELFDDEGEVPRGQKRIVSGRDRSLFTISEVYNFDQPVPDGYNKTEVC
jgi:hypothetical protein